MEQKRKYIIASREKKRAFVSVFILFSILLFLSLVRVEYELLQYLAKTRTLQHKYFEKIREEALLEAALEEEMYRAETYLHRAGKRNLEDYICRNERGEHLLQGDWGGLSVGGYHIRAPKPKTESQESYKLYYYKHIFREDANLHYEIQVLVDYSYEQHKSLSGFHKSQIREVRIYLL